MHDAGQQVASLPLRLEPATSINPRLARLADLAGESGLVLDEIQPGPAADGSHYQTVPIRLAGGGSYPAVAVFLHRLRERFPDTAVRSFECSNTAPGADRPSAAFRAELAWYTAPVAKQEK